MYAAFLILHNVAVGCVGVLPPDQRLGRSAGGAADRSSTRLFALLLSLQFVFGAVLYLLPGGPVNGVPGNVGWATIMKDRVLRSFTLEHPPQMTIAIGVSRMANTITTGACRRSAALSDRNDPARFDDSVGSDRDAVAVPEPRSSADQVSVAAIG